MEDQWCKLVPCNHILCLHCTIELHCARGAQRLECPGCHTQVSSIQKRKAQVVVTSSITRSGNKKRVEMVDESFQCNYDDYTRKQENTRTITISLPASAKQGEFVKEYLPKSFELPDMREAALRPNKTFTITGGIARSVHRWEFHEDHACTKYGDKDESNNWDDYPVAPPPPPPKEYHDLYGINHNYGSLIGALEAAQNGDKIYIPPGTYHVNCDDFMSIEKSIEVIGMGENPEDTVIYRNRRIDINIDAKCGLPVRIVNLTLRHGTGYDKWHMSKSDDEPMLALHAGSSSMNNVDLVLDNCIIDMGTDEGQAKETPHMETAYKDTPTVTRHPGFVSGILIQEANSVTISRCHFKGGTGSAIVMTNDPDLDDAHLGILSCTFTDCGQPNVDNKGLAGSIKKVPAPGTIEFWTIQRKKNQRFESSLHPIRLAGNQFASNLNAPIVSRSLLDDELVNYKHTPEVNLLLPVDHDGGAALSSSSPSSDDEAPHFLTEAFKISLHQNRFDSNGAQVDCSQFTGDCDSFPCDGEAMLVVQDETYPSYGGEGSESTRWILIYEPRD
jgi:hypothetical protein